MNNEKKDGDMSETSLHPSDTELLDFLEKQLTGYGAGVVLRKSTTGRGMRLHETSDLGLGYKCADPQPTVRQAIIEAMKIDSKENL